jgi:hypothetical protein
MRGINISNMPNKELKQAWLIVHSSITGAIFGVGINSIYNNFTWQKLLTFFITMWIIVYILKLSIKHNS